MEHPNFWYFLARFLARTYDVAWSSWGGNKCSKDWWRTWNIALTGISKGKQCRLILNTPLANSALSLLPKSYKTYSTVGLLVVICWPCPQPRSHAPGTSFFAMGVPSHLTRGNSHVAILAMSQAPGHANPGHHARKRHTSCHQWHMFDLFLLGGDTSIQHKPGKRTS